MWITRSSNEFNVRGLYELNDSLYIGACTRDNVLTNLSAELFIYKDFSCVLHIHNTRYSLNYRLPVKTNVSFCTLVNYAKYAANDYIDRNCHYMSTFKSSIIKTSLKSKVDSKVDSVR